MTDTYQNAVDGAYKNNMPYPSRPKKPVLKDQTPAAARAYADELEAYAEDVKQYEEERRAYGAESARLEAKFRDDLEAEHDTKGHPKADMLYSMAYDRGHSAGMSEVANYYDELSQLIK
jgi:hypothetical protein